MLLLITVLIQVYWCAVLYEKYWSRVKSLRWLIKWSFYLPFMIIVLGFIKFLTIECREVNSQHLFRVLYSNKRRASILTKRLRKLLARKEFWPEIFPREDGKFFRLEGKFFRKNEGSFVWRGCQHGFTICRNTDKQQLCTPLQNYRVIWSVKK